MKKALALILSLALAVSALTACGGASSSAAGSTSGSAPASAAPSGEKTVVTVWHMYAEDEEVTKPHQRLLQWAENYNATNTDNIEVVVSGAKTADVIMTTIASGSTPDIFQNYWNNAPTWANNGALYDLTEFVNGGDAEWNKDDFIDAAWDVCTYEDMITSY
ncbi:MAG: extracellular solute-binding protein [Ruthenibacterium lactatiformans]